MYVMGIQTVRVRSGPYRLAVKTWNLIQGGLNVNERHHGDY